MLIMTKTERNGVLVLLSLIVIVIVVRLILPGYLHDDASYLKEIDEKIALLEIEKAKVASAPAENSSDPEVGQTMKQPVKEETIPDLPHHLFEFDPNLVSYDSLIMLGFSQRVAHTLIKYREKGGSYRTKSDLLRIYGLDSTFYEQIRKYVVIKSEAENEKRSSAVVASYEAKPKIILEINTADSAQWTTLSGIGPVFAKRICSFRNYLGGFISLDQLKEVYHLPPETYQSIKDQLTLDTTYVRKININFADINDLKKHPYCTYELARKLITYRAENGSIHAIEQLLNDSVFSINDYQRFGPYLTTK